MRNIKVLHYNGIIHREPKIDNLSFGPLFIEKYIYKSTVGLLDFGNSKLLRKKQGGIDFQSGYTQLNGNKNFSSTNGLLDKDVMPCDDIENIFLYTYIFIKWSASMETIKKIRKAIFIKRNYKK